jgi:serine/threonine-protein kinase RsbT
MKRLGVVEEGAIAVASDADIVAARLQGRAMSLQLGFRPTDATLIATAISELARNILLYAKSGEIAIWPIERGERTGLTVVARDAGPGIADPARAMEDGFSTSGRLGLGLPGVRRLMDEFDLRTGPGQGTVVTVKKWII